MRNITRGTAVIGAGVVSVALAGIAYAAWTSSGTGAGTAKSFDTVTSTITAGTVTADLYPGGTGSMSVTIKNLNPYPATVTSIGAGTSDASGSCAANIVTTDANNAPGGGTLAPNAEATYTVVTHMAATATNVCRNVEFNIPLTATLTTGS